VRSRGHSPLLARDAVVSLRTDIHGNGDAVLRRKAGARLQLWIWISTRNSHLRDSRVGADASHREIGIVTDGETHRGRERQTLLGTRGMCDGRRDKQSGNYDFTTDANHVANVKLSSK